MARIKSGVVYHAPRELTYRDKGYFTVHGVSDGGETATYDVAEEMFPSMAQERLAEVSEAEKQAGRPHAANMPLTFAIMEAAARETGRQFRDFLKENLRHFPNTLTRIRYHPEGELDEVVHNYGTSDQYILEGNVGFNSLLLG